MSGNTDFLSPNKPIYIVLYWVMIHNSWHWL